MDGEAMDKDSKYGLISVSLILIVFFSMLFIAAPVSATSATAPSSPITVQQGEVFLLRGSITFDQASDGNFVWGPVYWYHYGDPAENFSLENTPSVYWTSGPHSGLPVENVRINDYPIPNGWQVDILDNFLYGGGAIEVNGTFNIDIWLRAASGDGTPHRPDNQEIYFSLNRITLWEPNQFTASAGPITVQVLGRGVDVSISPSENSGEPCTTLNYLVTVKNTGNLGDDNYDLTVIDNESWSPSLDNSSLSIPAGENRTTTLRVTIPENAENCTRDNVTVTATSHENAQVSDSASCIAHAVVTAEEFTLQLVAGWNLVGFVIEDTPNNVFTGLNYYTDYYIYYWNAPGGPYGLQGPDQVLEDNAGYWVWINQDNTVTTSGIPPPSREIHLVAGWNLVSFPIANENTTPNNVFTGLNYYTDYYIYYWSAPGGPYGLQGPDQVLEDNLGYCVWINQNKTVTVP